jgi:serine/threonine-protein kinase
MDNTQLPGQTDPSPWQQIGPYVIDREIGAGGMGTVYLARHQATGQEVAIKVLPAAMAREPGFVARFNREIEAMRQLADANENIVQLYESGEHAGTYYYAMEYVPGETLTARLLREKRLPWRQVIDFGVQICRALKAAHNAGVVHRDLKPSNLLIHENGTIKLTDFGIAQVFATSKLTVTGGILGTAEYMSPEQAQGKRASKQSDIYSLGAVLYVMLTGRPPFTGKTTLEIALKHKFSQFDSPRRIVPDIPHWLDEVVCKCLAKKPEDRYPDAYVLGLRLQEIPRKVDLALSQAEFGEAGALAGRETEAADPGAAPQQQVGGTFVRDLMRVQLDEQEQRSPLVRWFDHPLVLSVILLAVLLTTGWLFWNNRPSPERLFARGENLMQMKPGPAWDSAERECFQPLLQLDPDTWSDRVEPYLEKIRQYRFEKELLGTPRGHADTPQSLPNLVLQRALSQVHQGDFKAARRDLEALILLLTDDEEFENQRKLAEKLLEEVSTREADPTRFALLERARNRAKDLEAAGDLAGAAALRQAIEQLFANGPVDSQPQPAQD